MNTGAIAIQGCALRIARLNSDGSISAASATGMAQDDKALIKFTATPVVEAGVEMNPKSACGALLASVKDFDRIKRWNGQLDLGDIDFDKMEMIGGGALITAGTKTGRTFADGITVLNSPTLTSAALSAFTAQDVGRSVTGTGIPASTFITRVDSALSAQMNNAATASASGLSIVLGALAARTIGYSFPSLLSVANQNGVSLEIWQKAIVRGTGYIGTTPYPSVGSLATPSLPNSGYVRWGVFRFIPTPMTGPDAEDKESTRSWSGWCLENPMFGLGPAKDWTDTAVAGGVPIDTTKWCDALMDFQLPTPLQPGYQTTAA